MKPCILYIVHVRVCVGGGGWMTRNMLSRSPPTYSLPTWPSTGTATIDWSRVEIAAKKPWYALTSWWYTYTEQQATLSVCTEYDINGVKESEIPASLHKFRSAKPIYKQLPGWGDITSSMLKDGYDSLPNELKSYVQFIENQVNCKVSIISVGPERHQTIIR